MISTQSKSSFLINMIWKDLCSVTPAFMFRYSENAGFVSDYHMDYDCISRDYEK